MRTPKRYLAKDIDASKVHRNSGIRPNGDLRTAAEKTHPTVGQPQNQAARGSMSPISHDEILKSRGPRRHPMYPSASGGSMFDTNPGGDPWRPSSQARPGPVQTLASDSDTKHFVPDGTLNKQVKRGDLKQQMQRTAPAAAAKRR